jgi:hypothetical protein
MKKAIKWKVIPMHWQTRIQWLRSDIRKLGEQGRKPRSLLWTLVLLTACSSVVSAQKVKVGYDKTADFSKYTTYTWAPPGVPPTRPLLYYHVVGTIDEYLQSKGLKRTEQGGDLILAGAGGVGFGVHTLAGTPIVPAYSGLPPSIDSGMWVGASGVSNGMAPLLAEGTLLLEFVDQRANKVVWSGSVSEKLDTDKKKESLKRVDRALAKLLSKFPPEKKK